MNQVVQVVDRTGVQIGVILIDFADTSAAITEAKARLTNLVRRAEDGEDVMLTRHGHAVVRLVAIHHKPSAANQAKLIAAIRARP